MKNNLKHVFVLATLLISCIHLSAQETEKLVPVNFYLGGSCTISPSFDIDGRWTVNTKTSANFYSIYADIVINKFIFGRVQTSFLAIPSLGDDLSSELESGFQLNGSVGYNYQLKNNKKISIPIMATLGYATITDSENRDAGMQVGSAIGLHYQLNESFSANGTFRYLKGIEISGGAKFNQLDFSLGIQCRLF